MAGVETSGFGELETALEDLEENIREVAEDEALGDASTIKETVEKNSPENEADRKPEQIDLERSWVMVPNQSGGYTVYSVAPHAAVLEIGSDGPYEISSDDGRLKIPKANGSGFNYPRSVLHPGIDGTRYVTRSLGEAMGGARSAVLFSGKIDNAIRKAGFRDSVN